MTLRDITDRGGNWLGDRFDELVGVWGLSFLDWPLWTIAVWFGIIWLIMMLVVFPFVAIPLANLWDTYKKKYEVKFGSSGFKTWAAIGLLAIVIVLVEVFTAE